MRIAIVVHGRFHAFDLARELIVLGNEVTVITNLPKAAVKRFGLPTRRVRSLLLNGAFFRISGRLGFLESVQLVEAVLHRWFSRAAIKHIASRDFDVVYAFSGVAEELFKALEGRDMVRTVVRGSSHVVTQRNILEEEARRTGHRVEKPSEWRIARELREYEAADLVTVLSTFAYKSFIEEGFPKTKLRLMLSGYQAAVFRPKESAMAERRKRLEHNRRLRVLTIGTFSLRKGAFDYVAVARALGNVVEFRFVGDVSNDAKWLLEEACAFIEFVGRKDHFDLPAEYAWGDVFLFPSVEDGFPAVLGQAMAASLLTIATCNSSAPDLIIEGETGWIVPARRPDLIIERLLWLEENRDTAVAMLKNVGSNARTRDWAEVAADFTKIHKAELNMARDSHGSQLW